jgi:hypothetical protein
MCEDSNNNNGVIHYIGELALLVIHGVVRQCPFNTGGKHSSSNFESVLYPLCSVSRWRLHKVDKRMVLEYTHGLFIT